MTHKQANSIFLQPLEKQNDQLLLTYVASINPAGWAMDLVPTPCFYHVPEHAVWVLWPLLFSLWPLLRMYLSKACQTREKRCERMFHESLSTLIWEAEAKPCPSMYSTTCVLWAYCAGESIWASGEEIGGNRLISLATITCSLAAPLVTAKRKKIRGVLLTVYGHWIKIDLPWLSKHPSWGQTSCVQQNSFYFAYYLCELSWKLILRFISWFLLESKLWGKT